MSRVTVNNKEDYGRACITCPDFRNPVMNPLLNDNSNENFSYLGFTTVLLSLNKEDFCVFTIEWKKNLNEIEYIYCLRKRRKC